MGAAQSLVVPGSESRPRRLGSRLPCGQRFAHTPVRVPPPFPPPATSRPGRIQAPGTQGPASESEHGAPRAGEIPGKKRAEPYLSLALGACRVLALNYQIRNACPRWPRLQSLGSGKSLTHVHLTEISGMVERKQFGMRVEKRLSLPQFLLLLGLTGFTGWGGVPIWEKLP